MEYRSAVLGLVRLSRPGNVAGAGLLALTGAYVAGALTQPIAMAVATGATALGTAAGNAINDYFDREIDAINRPDRPVPAGLIAPATARRFATITFAIAVVLTVAMLPLLAIAIAAINLVLLITYTQVFKGTPGLGNAIVAFLVGSALWFGGAAVGGVEATLVLGALAALATFAREVVKDIEDIEGDRTHGLRTLPVVIGSRRAWVAAVVALLLGLLISPIPYLRGTFDLYYLLGLAPALVVMGYGGLRSRYEPGQGQRLLKLGMYLALLAFVIGRLEVPV